MNIPSRMPRILICLLATAITVNSGTAMAEDDLVFVQTRGAALQVEPKILSRAAKRLTYGDSLLVISKESGWLKVRAADRTEGFIHPSAISSRRLVLSGTRGGDAKVTDADISLAGKGFSPEIEKQLAAQNRELDFKGVDAMEKISISPDQTKLFIKNGKLNQDAF